MGKLSELVNKGVKLIVADAEEEASAQTQESPPPPPRQREIPADALGAEPPRRVEHSEVSASVADFGKVYGEAGIEPPAHGYGIDKVAEMLENKRFATLGREAKATAVMVALEAASVPIRDVIQDAVCRDKALDAFEADKQREVREIQTKNQARIQDLNRQLEELIQKINAEVEGLKRSSEEATRAFAELQTRKREEEDRLHSVVSHFIEGADNPITTSQSPPPPKPGPA